MSQRRKCKYCGKQINFRQMPHGKWVAFEGYDTPHVCGKVSAKKEWTRAPRPDLVSSRPISSSSGTYDDLDFDDFELPGIEATTPAQPRTPSNPPPQTPHSSPSKEAKATSSQSTGSAVSVQSSAVPSFPASESELQQKPKQDDSSGCGCFMFVLIGLFLWLGHGSHKPSPRPQPSSETTTAQAATVPADKPVTVCGVAIGQSRAEVSALLGEPTRSDKFQTGLAEQYELPPRGLIRLSYKNEEPDIVSGLSLFGDSISDPAASYCGIRLGDPESRVLKLFGQNPTRQKLDDFTVLRYSKDLSFVVGQHIVQAILVGDNVVGK